MGKCHISDYGVTGVLLPVFGDTAGVVTFVAVTVWVPGVPKTTWKVYVPFASAVSGGNPAPSLLLVILTVSVQVVTTFQSTSTALTVTLTTLLRAAGQIHDQLLVFGRQHAEGYAFVQLCWFHGCISFSVRVEALRNRLRKPSHKNNFWLVL